MKLSNKNLKLNSTLTTKAAKNPDGGSKKQLALAFKQSTLLSSQTTNTHHQPTPGGADQRGDSTCFGGTPSPSRPLRVRQLRRSPSPAPHVRLSSDPAGRSRPSGPTACASSYLRPVRCREMRLHRPARTVNTLTRP